MSGIDDAETLPRFEHHPARRRESVPTITILWHPDLERVGEEAKLVDLVARRSIELSRLEPRFTQPGKGGARPLEDIHLSRTGWLLKSTRGGGILLDPRSSKIRLEVDGRALDEPLELDSSAIATGVVLLLEESVALILHLQVLGGPTEDPYDMVGYCAGLIEARRKIHRLSRAREREHQRKPVLIRGESGTGKELVARALHSTSRRSSRPMQTLNMGAIPPGLAASELFGTRQGAFPGARTRRGIFRRADGGTLFLDEIGEAPPEVQVALLRAIEQGEIQTVGDSKTHKVDVRVLAATDADLEELAAEGRFARALLGRLRALEIYLPPLRHRKEDIGRLLVHFLRLGTGGGLGFFCGPRGESTSDHGDSWWLAARTVAELARYAWPGNIRELRDLVDRLLIESLDEPFAVLPKEIELAIEAEIYDTILGSGPPAPRPPAPSPTTRPTRPLAGMPNSEILGALREARGDRKKTAERLEVPRSTLYDRLARMGFPPAAKLSANEILTARERHRGDLQAVADEKLVSLTALLGRMRNLGLDPEQ